ncbi:jg16960 [Pararge aegeria aegeria]|uniref:Jg16960 protein n=1 Tax=Pararge aegeria aegeria TaxID=348720 RepID=A0A8S4RHB0_9NEOP|nr:jg16960 [Pararge aegeria aegeria]
MRRRSRNNYNNNCVRKLISIDPKGQGPDSRPLTPVSAVMFASGVPEDFRFSDGHLPITTEGLLALPGEWGERESSP